MGAAPKPVQVKKASMSDLERFHLRLLSGKRNLEDGPWWQRRQHTRTDGSIPWAALKYDTNLGGYRLEGRAVIL